MMTPAHIARLRRNTQDFVDEQKHQGPVKMSDISKHIIALGWNMADREMFKEWVSQNITGPIDYQN